MGRNGGRGHEGLARVESGKPENDPYAVHYEMIEPDSVTLVDQVQTTAMGIAERLTYRSDDNPNTESDYLTPGGSWVPGVWWIGAPQGFLEWEPWSLSVGFWEISMSKSMRSLWNAVLIVLAACAPLPQGLAAQRLTDAHPAEILDRFASEEASPGGPHGASSAITYVFRHRADYPPATVRSLIDGLERLALESGNGNVRHSSVRYLVLAGRFSDERPEPGLLARLKRIYASTSDPELRAVVVMSMGGLAERKEAIAFLDQVARQDPASEEFPNAALWALRVLPGMGDEGRAELKKLHESNAVKHPEARHDLSVFASKGYKVK
jgi:hypothetical protein